MSEEDSAPLQSELIKIVPAIEAAPFFLSSRDAFEGESHFKPNKAIMNPPATAIKYVGSFSATANDLFPLDLYSFQDAASDKYGSLIGMVSSCPTQANGWSFFRRFFLEYRVLAMSIHYSPTLDFAKDVGVRVAPLAIVFENSTFSNNLVSYFDVADYPVNKYGSLLSSFHLYHKMNSIQESFFVDTAVDTFKFSFKWFANELSDNYLFGNFRISWRCQFRGYRQSS